MLELSKKYKTVPVLVGHHRAHNPIITAAQTIVKSGALGKLTTFSGSALFYKPDEYFMSGLWRTIKGGGPLLINMIHEVDTLRRLMGEVHAVSAVATNHYRNYEVEDSAAIVFEFLNGAIGTFILSDVSVSNKSWEHTSGENAAYPISNCDCYHITGTHGALNLPSLKLYRYFDEQSRSWWNPLSVSTYQYASSDPIDLQLLHFTKVINKEMPPYVTVLDGYTNLTIIEAIKESSHRASRIVVNNHL